ncbi:hypothetical protein EVAR_40802_1 [Eumeta japonica]|uniref:Uncharacterized protein n=1 Tax=Eumeta variegata TaxID=151549 RepID=A0A4C1X4N3_EUMVA|nr:hypothetical protein EVAR_40802_1 [Eumeta japonica]
MARSQSKVPDTMGSPRGLESERWLGHASPSTKGVGKEEKNPLWAVHAPGHTVMSSARDYPMGVFLSRHLGIGGYVDWITSTLQHELKLRKALRKTREAHRIDDL